MNALSTRRFARVLLSSAAIVGGLPAPALAGPPPKRPLVIPPYDLPAPGVKWLTDKEYSDHLDSDFDQWVKDSMPGGAKAGEEEFGDSVMPDGDGETIQDGDGAPDVSWFEALLASLGVRSVAEAVSGGSGVLVEGSPMGGILVGKELCEKWSPSMCPSAADLADEAELGRLQAWADEHPSGGGVVAAADGPVAGIGGAGGAGSGAEGAGGGAWSPPEGLGGPSGSVPEAPAGLAPEVPGASSGSGGDGVGDSGEAVDVDPGGVDDVGDSGSGFDYDADTGLYDEGTDTDVYDGVGAGDVGGGSGAGGLSDGVGDGGMPEYVDPEKGGYGGAGGVDEGGALDDDTGDGGSTGQGGSSEDNNDEGPNSSEDSGSGADDAGSDGSSDDGDGSGGEDPDCSGDDCGEGGDDGGGYPNPDDPSGGCVGPKCHGVVTERGGEVSNPAERVENPNPEGDGPSGPVVHDGSAVTNPNPDGGGPVGPAVLVGHGAEVMNPNPDGGGPDGPVVVPSDKLQPAG